MKQCNFDSCLSPVIARGWCNTHYRRWLRNGDAACRKRIQYKSAEEAFAARTVRQGECLVWTGTLNTKGYGQMRDKGKMYRVHRWAYEQVHGAIPDGLVIDHLCHNRACAEITHLREVTNKQNMENRRSANVKSSSGYRGVSWDKVRKKWLAKVTSNGVPYHGGYFLCVEDANQAAIALRAEIFTHHQEV